MPCSTFLLKHESVLLIGHNLDDDIEVPGLVVADPRGVAKHNLSWDALRVGPFVKEPRLEWVSKYGSLTYNPMGREFPDGGLNEAGLYVGEMTLFGTRYPADPALPKLYDRVWMQYLLDNFVTVEEALAGMEKVCISGHCQWHFFLADRGGDCAVVEFVDGQAVIRHGATLPYPLLCNRAYARDLDLMHTFVPFGGDRPLPFDDCAGDPRFAWAVSMMQKFPASGQDPTDYAFSILKQMDCGNNKWSLVYDLAKMRLSFHTYRARAVRFVDFSAFDFSPSAPAMLLDIHQPLEGDLAGHFVAYTEEKNYAVLSEFMAGINWGGFVLNKLWMPNFRRNIREGVQSFKAETSTP